MRGRHGLVAALVAGIAFMVPTRPAAADRICSLDPLSGQIRCVNSDPGGQRASGGEGGGSSGSALGRWTIWTNNAVSETTPCPADPVTGITPGHTFLQFTPLNDPTNTRIVDSWCPSQAVGLPPPPPTPAELRGIAAAPTPEINLSPASRGVTGVPTRLWGGSDSLVTVGPLTLRGWSVTGSATPTTWTWEPGTGEILSSSDAGSEGSPAATYVYEAKGTFTVETTVTYEGGFTLIGPYGVTVTATIGAIDVTSSQAYDVIEVRAARD